MEFDKINYSIHTDRLFLRLFEKNDAETVKELCNNINIYKTTLYIPYPYTLNDALSWMENHKKNFDEDRSYELAITDKNSGDLLGAISLSNNQKFKNEKLALENNIEFLNGILTDRNKLDRLLISDLKEIAKKYGNERKTEIYEQYSKTGFLLKLMSVNTMNKLLKMPL